MNTQGKTILVTGANRGIGAELVHALILNGAGRIYAGTRELSNLPDFGDDRVTFIKLDITKNEDIAAAVEKIGAIDILVNNAGAMLSNNIVTATQEELASDLDVNYFGTIKVMQAFIPVMEKNGGGVIANVLSVLALAPMSFTAGYAASKAAMHSATQAARGLLKTKNIKVVGIYPGPIDTRLSSELMVDKTPANVAAEEIVKGLINDLEDIYPDPTSQQVSGFWGSDPKGLEHHFSNF
ncbi:SDR family oxidoreductase [Pectobacterium jejuense]|uniref:SDR family oxidoreductase n=1 Tax=Pectobacterium jejuense TaxID=2974022 RepID=UPI00381D0B5D